MKVFQYFQAGVSLIELIIAMCLSLLLLTALAESLQISFLAWSAGGARVESRQNSRMALAAVLNEVRYARAILWPAGQRGEADRLVILNSSGVKVSFQLGTSTGAGSRTLYRSVGAVDNPLTGEFLSAVRFAVDHAAVGQPAIVSATLLPDTFEVENGQILQGSVTCPNVE